MFVHAFKKPLRGLSKALKNLFRTFERPLHVVETTVFQDFIKALKRPFKGLVKEFQWNLKEIIDAWPGEIHDEAFTRNLQGPPLRSFK